jgi:DNA helicase-2/ATP-dependent DNA helicase PcrA
MLDLLYKLIVWLPVFQHDSEHQIYLEAVMRCVTQAANFSKYDMHVLRGAGGTHDSNSATAVFRDFLAPLADGLVEVDEDLLFSPPRNRLNIMTIHQAKGLEFPVVIVDVGSDFERDHPKQRFRRFPDDASPTVAMETHLAPYSPIGSTRTSRPEMDRTFDDLRRLYYVAYSRPQAVLILVGLTKLIQYQTKIRHVGTFWRQPVAAAPAAWSWQAQPPATKSVPAHPEFLSQYLHLI